MTVAGRAVLVGLGLDVDVGVKGRNINVLVGLAATTGVGVTEEIVVGAREIVAVALENGVLVAVDMPGVRNSSIQAGSVRMAESTGSMTPLGRRVRNSLFGSR